MANRQYTDYRCEGKEGRALAASWAGNFDCHGGCERKRLVAAEFSKKMLEKRRMDSLFKIKCKMCVENVQKAERDAAKAKQAAAAASVSVTSGDGGQEDAGPEERHKCSACKDELPEGNFNKNQLRKGPGKQRCRDCVEKAEEKASKDLEAKRLAASASANAAANNPALEGKDKLQAEALSAALEGELVTGLKPIKLGSGRGRGGRGGSWRGRGR
eukprot:GFYU01018820.1.p1 GENE.GFYU01018820.1~~GFYU01018820.1.p1  ORF type:complete len:215 (-),score=50.02 GFYU01018820.1:100-744(-)